MKKLVFLFLLVSLMLSGCGDKFAKEKEEILKAEQSAMAMQLPQLVKPDYTKNPPPTRQEYEKYWQDFKKLVETETEILDKMRKSDAKIAEIESKATESEKKDLQTFKDKVRKARVDFVKKISKGRLDGDPVIVGIGSTWQEIEMVHGKPNLKNTDYSCTYDYDGLIFSAWYTKGVPRKGEKWTSWGPYSLELTKDKFMSDAGVKIGMTREEVQKTLKANYVQKSKYPKGGITFEKHKDSKIDSDIILHYSMKDTGFVTISTCHYKNGKLVSYGQYPN